MSRILMLLVITVSCKVQAQDNAVHKPATVGFHSFNTVHILNGSTTTSLALHSVNGIQVGKFFTGIGTGFDYYYHVSVPLFIEARIDLLKGKGKGEEKGKLQLFGNGGLNFPFSSPNRKLETNNGSYKTGSLYGAGLDYLIPANKEIFILGLAFSNKQVIQMVDNMVWNPMLNRAENIPIKGKYSLNRIAIRLGLVF